MTHESSNALNRRQALRKGVVGAGAAGVAWTAPSVTGLTLRPDFAGAQSGPADTPIDVPGTSVSFSFAVQAPKTGDFGFSVTDPLPPGLNLVLMGFNFDSNFPGSEHCASYRISQDAANCSITQADASPFDIAFVSSSNADNVLVYGSTGSAPVTMSITVTCT